MLHESDDDAVDIENRRSIVCAPLVTVVLAGVKRADFTDEAFNMLV